MSPRITASPPAGGFAAVALAAGLALPVGPGAAQATGPEALGTLHAWAEGVWMSLVDPGGSYHGRLAEEGFFQRFNPLADHEYELDVHTGLFSPAEDARWADAPAGLRAAAGSISHPHIIQEAEWSDRFPIAGEWALDARYLRERTLSASRDHLRPGVAWRPSRDGAWEARATLGLHFFKPSADVEVGAARVWSGPEGERGRAELRLAFLDAFSNLIFNRLGVDPDEVDAHFDHAGLPLALRADGRWQAGPLRLEARGGASRRSRARVTFPGTMDAPYDLIERVAFAGGLVEWHVGDRAAVGVRGTWARAERERLLDAPSPLDLRVREETRSAGVLARHRLSDELWLEAHGLGTWRPEDRETDMGSSDGTPGEVEQEAVRHRDREWHWMAALVRRPTAGWTARLAWAATDRDAGPLAAELTARNDRLVTEGGYRFASGFEATAGLRWDLDHFRGRAFDGAQLRFTTGGRP